VHPASLLSLLLLQRWLSQQQHLLLSAFHATKINKRLARCPTKINKRLARCPTGSSGVETCHCCSLSISACRVLNIPSNAQASVMPSPTHACTWSPRTCMQCHCISSLRGSACHIRAVGIFFAHGQALHAWQLLAERSTWQLACNHCKPPLNGGCGAGLPLLQERFVY
jgi:hypothetical protein